MGEVLDEEKAGVLFKGVPIPNIGYVDIASLMHANDLQRMVQKVHDASIRYGLNMSLKKQNSLDSPNSQHKTYN